MVNDLKVVALLQQRNIRKLSPCCPQMPSKRYCSKGGYKLYPGLSYVFSNQIGLGSRTEHFLAVMMKLFCNISVKKIWQKFCFHLHACVEIDVEVTELLFLRRRDSMQFRCCYLIKLQCLLQSSFNYFTCCKLSQELEGLRKNSYELD